MDIPIKIMVQLAYNGEIGMTLTQLQSQVHEYLHAVRMWLDQLILDGLAERHSTRVPGYDMDDPRIYYYLPAGHDGVLALAQLIV